MFSFVNFTYVTSPSSQLILKLFFRFIYVTAHSLTLPLLHLCHSSFSKPSFASPTSQALHLRHPASRPCQAIDVQFCELHLRHFTFVTAHSQTLLSLYLRHSSFSNPSIASPTSQLILQPLFRFSYVTGSSLTSPGRPPLLSNICSVLWTSPTSVHLRHNSFSNPSVALPTSQFIIQPFRCFTYVTAHSPALISLLLRHRLFTYVTWRAAHELCSFSNLFVTSPTSKLILQPFRRFTYVTAHSPILPFLHVRHSSFSNLSVPSPTSPGEPPMDGGYLGQNGERSRFLWDVC